MIKNLFAALAIAAIFTSCNSQSAFKYNQDFVAKEKSLTPDMMKTETDVERFAYAKQFDSIAVAGQRMADKIQEKITEIEKMPAPDAKGGDKFKAAALRYFQYMKKLYISYKNVGDAKTDEERQAEMVKMQEIVVQKEQVANDIRSAQQEYAAANNFKIEKF